MLDPRSISIEYAAQSEFVTQLEKLVDSKLFGTIKEKEWTRLDCVGLYLQTVSSKDIMTDDQITNLTYVYNCLIEQLKLFRIPAVGNGVTVEVPPTLSLVGPQGPQGLQGIKGDTGGGKPFNIGTISSTTTADSFPVGTAYAARWDYIVNGTPQRAGSVIATWTEDGSFVQFSDDSTDDAGVGSTAGIEFTVSFSSGNILLTAVVTTGSWGIAGTRYLIPETGNYIIPASSLSNGTLWIGNSSNLPQERVISGAVTINNTGVATLASGGILDTHINATADIAMSKLVSLTVNRVVVTNPSTGKLEVANATITEVNQLVGIGGTTVAAQLALKVTDPMTTIGDIIVRNASNITARLGIGGAGTVLQSNGTIAVWATVPGAISGLSATRLPKAINATTLADSIYADIGGGLATIIGSVEISSGWRTEATGPYFRIVQLDLGDWNMDVTTQVNIPHNLTLAKIRSVSATIRNDLNNTYTHVPFYNDSSGLIDLWFFHTTTTVSIGRRTGGLFDSTAYDLTGGFNRGWITIIAEI